MMSDPGPPTLDQLRIFLAAAEEGSFAAAGRKLNRAVSVISYGIANLEAQLGVRLFIREGTRKPVLTDAGRAVLSEARAVGDALDGLHAKVVGLMHGLEAEIHLVVDVMMLPDRLAKVLSEFAARFPTVTMHLHVEALGAVSAMVDARDASLGISGPLNAVVSGLRRKAAGAVELVAVAAPDHPLARQGPLREGDARGHVQLVLSDRSQTTKGRDFAVTALRTWRLADLGVKHALLRQGLGWGNMPLPMVRTDLLNGVLVRLDIPDHSVDLYRFHAVWRPDCPLGPAGMWLRDRFVELGKGDCERITQQPERK